MFADRRYLRAIIANDREIRDICSGRPKLPEGYTYYTIKFNENTGYPSVNVENLLRYCSGS